jgi:hypothetical protein
MDWQVTDSHYLKENATCSRDISCVARTFLLIHAFWSLELQPCHCNMIRVAYASGESQDFRRVDIKYRDVIWREYLRIVDFDADDHRHHELLKKCSPVALRKSTMSRHVFDCAALFLVCHNFVCGLVIM